MRHADVFPQDLFSYQNVRRIGKTGGLVFWLLAFAGCTAASKPCEVKEQNGQKVVVCPDGSTALLSDGQAGLSSLVDVVEVDANEDCPYGGQEIRSGLDANDDGVLGNDEVSLTTYVCNGENGNDGEAGQDGTAGAAGSNALVRVSVEDAGENCSAGGTKVEAGSDANDNGVLDEDEIDESQTVYVCNGEAGDAGANGQDALVLLTSESAGDNCLNGGTRIESGIDLNGNGQLDADEMDPTQTQFVCNGQDGQDGHPYRVNTSTVATGDGTCAAGGVRIDVWRDDNGDGQVNDDEIATHTTSYVCNGEAGDAGANGSDALVLVTSESAGDNCLSGGTRIESGIDLNGNGQLDADEMDPTQTQFVCNGQDGQDGHPYRVNTSTVATGDATCAAGGVRIDVWRDDNGDGQVNDDEIATHTTSYVCNGEAGAEGAQSLIEIDPATTAECQWGGSKIRVALDANGNGAMDDDEQTTADSALVCNGAPGQNANGASTATASLISISSVTASDSQTTGCAYGGVRVETGVDTDADGNLDGSASDNDNDTTASEVQATQYVCNGAELKAEATTPDAGSCLSGGYKVQLGYDLNQNNALESTEIREVFHICNGADGNDGQPGNDGQSGNDGQPGKNGQDGDDGKNALSVTSVLAPNATCTMGGVLVETGVDSDGDQVLDGSATDTSLDDDFDQVPDATEVTNRVEICNGQNGVNALIAVSAAPPTYCSAGGTFIEVGMDANGNGILDGSAQDADQGDGYSEVVTAQTTWVCAPGLQEQCDNLKDDDADGLVDCADPNCASLPVCDTGTTPLFGACIAASDCATPNGAEPICFFESASGEPGGTCSAWCQLDDAASCGSGFSCQLGADGDPSLNIGFCEKVCTVDSDCGRDGFVCAAALDESTSQPIPDSGLCRAGCAQNDQCNSGICDTRANVRKQDDRSVLENNPYAGWCRLPGCGNGILEQREECDDGNELDNDGCNSSCVLESACEAGETERILQLVTEPQDIPDAVVTNTVYESLFVSTDLAVNGTVRSLRVRTSVDHAYIGDLRAYVEHDAKSVDLFATISAEANTSMSDTLFADACDPDAGPLYIGGGDITSGAAPYSGCFTPASPLSKASDSDSFYGELASGTWGVRFLDIVQDDAGTVSSVELIMCTLPFQCGDGVRTGVEECDDGNTDDLDGCSASCQVEFTCEENETLEVLTGDGVGLTDGASEYFDLTALTLKGAIRKLQVGLSLLHDDLSQLSVSFVIEQDGALRTLFNGVADNEVGSHLLVFDDQCVAPLGLGPIANATDGSNGCYLPTEPLSGAQGLSASGSHKLYIQDSVSDGKSGTLNGFWMYVCVLPSVCGNDILEDGEECDEDSVACDRTTCLLRD